MKREKGFSGTKGAIGKRPRNRREYGSLQELQMKRRLWLR